MNLGDFARKTGSESSESTVRSRKIYCSIVACRLGGDYVCFLEEIKELTKQPQNPIDTERTGVGEGQHLD
jgi:hypothetical protein